MNISRNPDWENAQKRLEAFWHNEIIDRPCVQVYAPAPEKDYKDIEFDASKYNYETLWNDPEILGAGFKADYMRTVYLGEALPVLYPNWVGVPEMLGSNVKYDRWTIWVRPTVDSILDVNTDNLRLDNPLVTQLLNRLDRCAQIAKGEGFIGMPPMGNPGDHLAMVCGYENLCCDLIDNTKTVLAIEEKLCDFWKLLYDKIYETINKHSQGSCGWLPSWHPRRLALLEFDLCAMISPEMFKMYLPFILERAQHAEHSIYHLDGPGALNHLDTLLAQKEIHAIQWEPGVACENILEWLPVMQKIQAAGKGLYVAGARYSKEAVLQLLKNLKPQGLIVPVNVNSVDEGEQFIETVQKMF